MGIIYNLKLGVCALVCATALGCKLVKKPSDGSEGGENSNPNFFWGKTKELPFNVANGRFGLYPAGKRFCIDTDLTQEYHIKPLEKHMAWDSIYGAVCLHVARNTAFIVDLNTVIPTKIATIMTDKDGNYVVTSENAGNCRQTANFIDNSGQPSTTDIPHIASFLVKRLSALERWHPKEWGIVHYTGQLCENGNIFEKHLVIDKSFLSKMLVFNEEYHVKYAKNIERPSEAESIAKIWTNPGWKSWNIEDFQTSVNEPKVNRKVLYLFPAYLELVRRRK
jgi:hypothetical protein